MLLKAYFIITGVKRQLYIFQVQQMLEVIGTAWSLIIIYSSDGSHKLSNVEARGRRNPRRSKYVTRTMTKTTTETPVKSHSHGPLALCKRVKRRNQDALAMSPPSIIRLPGEYIRAELIAYLFVHRRECRKFNSVRKLCSNLVRTFSTSL